MSKLTQTMCATIALAREHDGKLYRFPGGFWYASKTELYGRKHFGTPTIEALVKRGLAEYTEWKEGARGKFPIEMTLKEVNQ